MSSSTQKRSQSQNFSRTFPWRAGAIPPELGRLTNLETLELQSNELEGAYDDSLPKMIRFRIYVQFNDDAIHICN